MLIFNKLDVIEQVGSYRLFELGVTEREFCGVGEFTSFVESYLHSNCEKLKTIQWSNSPDKI